MDYDLHVACLVLQKLAATILVRNEKENGSWTAQEDSFSVSILIFGKPIFSNRATATTDIVGVEQRLYRNWSSQGGERCQPQTKASRSVGCCYSNRSRFAVSAILALT